MITTLSDDDFRLVSSHDLRHHFVHRALVKERMNPRVVTSVGGTTTRRLSRPLETERGDDDSQVLGAGMD